LAGRFLIPAVSAVLSSDGKSRNDEQSFRYRRRRFIGANLVDRLLQSNVAVRGWDNSSTSQKSFRECPEASLGECARNAQYLQAADCGCHIVTVPHDILAKLMKLGGMDLVELSLGTVRMFHQDAVAAGFRL